jgi:hypothetical protein
MMRIVLLSFLMVVLLQPAQFARAEVDWSIVRTLALEEKPLDMVISADNTRIFVLVEGAKVLIYSPGGVLQETLALEGAIDGIALSSSGDLLYARNGANKTVEVIRLEFIQRITVGDSPVKGPEVAPVLIAVFSDFQ